MEAGVAIEFLLLTFIICMDNNFYLDQFSKAASRLDKKILQKKQIEVETGTWLQSVVVKFHKKHWANKPYEKPQTGAAIFFSAWISGKAEKENKIYYNIHALRLRQLKGYKIESRKFAAAFRKKFKSFESNWDNVSVDFGPLTLMEGWKNFNAEDLQNNITELARQFLEIDYIIDELLDDCKLPVAKNKKL
jgi:hypothetical protein